MSDEKKGGMSQDVKDAIALSAAMVAEQLKKSETASVRSPRDNGPKCEVCRQYAVACKGKHRRAIVHPGDGHFARFFDGVCINGVWYKSDHAGHAIDVPEDSQVENLVQTWLKNEVETEQGKKHQHFSGSIGSQGTQYNPATGWR